MAKLLFLELKSHHVFHLLVSHRLGSKAAEASPGNKKSVQGSQSGRHGGAGKQTNGKTQSEAERRNPLARTDKAGKSTRQALRQENRAWSQTQVGVLNRHCEKRQRLRSKSRERRHEGNERNGTNQSWQSST